MGSAKMLCSTVRITPLWRRLVLPFIGSPGMSLQNGTVHDACTSVTYGKFLLPGTPQPLVWGRLNTGMVRTHWRWLLGLLALLTLMMWGCGGGGAPGVPTDPSDPFNPSGPGGGGGGGGAGVVASPRGVAGQGLNSQIRVTFDRVAGASGYNVYLSEDGSTFVRFNSNSPYSATSILLTGLVNNRVYFVGVSAVFGSRESNTAYAGGSPTAQPIVPTAEPVGPAPLARDVISQITTWSNGNKPVATPTAPNDRRLLYSWEHEIDPNLVAFRIRYFIAATTITGSLDFPTTGTSNLIYFREQIQAPGEFANLQDTNFGRYDDPAMSVIRTATPITGGLARTEAVLQLPRNNNVLFTIINASGLSGADFLAALQNEYRYSLDALGLSLSSSGGLQANQDVLDGLDRIGFGVEISGIFRDGTVSTPDYAFGRVVDDIPERIPALNVIPVPNEGWDPDNRNSSPVLPQVTWNRLRFPMGSDIVDYGVIRRGPLLNIPTDVTVVFLLSANGGNNLIYDNVASGDLRELLGFSDGKKPEILRGRPYTYSLFAVDRAGREGPPSSGFTFTPGPPLNQPPTLVVQVRQGTTTIFPEGTNEVRTGTSENPVIIDFSGTTDPEGDALIYFYQILPAQTQPTSSVAPTVQINGIACVSGTTPVTLRVAAQDAAGNLSTQDIPINLVPGSGCT